MPPILQGGPVLAAVLECGSNKGSYQWGRSLLGMAVAKADKEQARAIIAACRPASAPYSCIQATAECRMQSCMQTRLCPSVPLCRACIMCMSA